MTLSADCLSRLGLRQAPFEDLPGESFVHTDPLLESLGDSASRALAMPGAIVILTGVEGSGRSLQLMRLLGLVVDRFELIAFRARSGIRFDTVEATMRLQLHADRNEAAAQPLPGILAERVRQGRIPLVAIDDAHLFDADILPMLLRLRHQVLESERQAPRLLLVGDPALAERRLGLADPDDERQVVRLALRPFNREQSWAYLRHRLRAAGHDDPEALLTPAAVDALLIGGRGLPGGINAVANVWLARQCESESESGSDPDSLVQSLAARLAALGSRNARAQAAAADESAGGEAGLASPPPGTTAAALAKRAQSGAAVAAGGARIAVRPPSQKVPVWNRRWFVPALVGGALAATLVPVILQLPGGTRPPADSARDLLAEGWGSAQPPAKGPVPVPPPIPGPVTSLPTESVSDPSAMPPDSGGSAAATAPSTGEQAEAGAAPPADPTPPGTTPAPQPPTGGGARPTMPPLVAAFPPRPPESRQAAGQPAAAAPSAQARSPAPTAAAPDGSAQPAPTAVVADGSAQPAAPATGAIPSAPSTATPTDEPAASPAATRSGVDWLRGQDPGFFTIQLVASRDPARARAYLAPHRLDGVQFIQTRSLMIGVIGSYPTQAAAQQAARELPPAVRADIWIRGIGTVLATVPR